MRRRRRGVTGVGLGLSVAGGAPVSVAELQVLSDSLLAFLLPASKFENIFLLICELVMWRKVSVFNK